MTILTVQLIVEFSKRVPFFDRLFREDQITLLKVTISTDCKLSSETNPFLLHIGVLQ